MQWIIPKPDHQRLDLPPTLAEMYRLTSESRRKIEKEMKYRKCMPIVHEGDTHSLVTRDRGTLPFHTASAPVPPAAVAASYITFAFRPCEPTPSISTRFPPFFTVTCRNSWPLAESPHPPFLLSLRLQS